MSSIEDMGVVIHVLRVIRDLSQGQRAEVDHLSDEFGRLAARLSRLLLIRLAAEEGEIADGVLSGAGSGGLEVES